MARTRRPQVTQTPASKPRKVTALLTATVTKLARLGCAACFLCCPQATKVVCVAQKGPCQALLHRPRCLVCDNHKTTCACGCLVLQIKTDDAEEYSNDATINKFSNTCPRHQTRGRKVVARKGLAQLRRRTTVMRLHANTTWCTQVHLTPPPAQIKVELSGLKNKEQTGGRQEHVVTSCLHQNSAEN